MAVIAADTSARGWLGQTRSAVSGATSEKPRTTAFLTTCAESASAQTPTNKARAITGLIPLR
jgi:hypothetical protein